MTCYIIQYDKLQCNMIQYNMWHSVIWLWVHRTHKHMWRLQSNFLWWNVCFPQCKAENAAVSLSVCGWLHLSGIQRVYNPHSDTLPLAFRVAGPFPYYPDCNNRRAPYLTLCQVSTRCASLCPSKLQRPSCPRCTSSGTWFRAPLGVPRDTHPAFY